MTFVITRSASRIMGSIFAAFFVHKIAIHAKTNLMETLEKHYRDLYETDLKHLERNLSHFIKEKERLDGKRLGRNGKK